MSLKAIQLHSTSAEQRWTTIWLKLPGCSATKIEHFGGMADHPINRIGELLPWNLAANLHSEPAEAP
jgi:hypothetical protein